MVTSEMRQVSANNGWEQIRDKVNQIIAEMDSSESPKPTHQMCHLLVAGEDRRFRHHPGVDPIALCRALWKTVFCGQIQGASTIAMQCVRVLTGRYERTLWRKLREMILAVRLTYYAGRDRLPALYLWLAYYGWQMNSFREACIRTRFDPLAANELEAAMLVARLKYPEPRDFDHKQLQKIRRRATYLMSLGPRREERSTMGPFRISDQLRSP